MPRAAAVVLCLLLALPLLGLGGACGGYAAKALWDHTRSADWLRVKAAVVGGSFGTRPGEPGSGHFAYSVGGQRYEGRRLGVGGIGADDIDTWRADAAEDLARAKAAGQSVMVFVDPDDPSDSLLDRELPWDRLILAGLAAAALLPAGVGAVVSALTVAAGRPAPRAPDPKSGGPGFLWFFAIVWNAMAFGVSWLVLPDILDDGEWMGLLLLLFPLAGMLLVWGATGASVASLRARTKPKPIHLRGKSR